MKSAPVVAAVRQVAPLLTRITPMALSSVDTSSPAPNPGRCPAGHGLKRSREIVVDEGLQLAPGAQVAGVDVAAHVRAHVQRVARIAIAVRGDDVVAMDVLARERLQLAAAAIRVEGDRGAGGARRVAEHQQAIGLHDLVHGLVQQARIHAAAVIAGVDLGHARRRRIDHLAAIAGRVDLHRIDDRQVAGQIALDATGLHDRARRNAVAGHDGVQAGGADHALQPLAGNQRAAVGGAQHHFADRPALGLRLGQQRRQRHHVGVGHPATEEDAVALHVITHCHDVISRREGADADQPGQGQA
ncbi:hypothetical protein G6F22_015189 [Rhizopus arrhizus]|nr:hypothetical protein G6F22_015189 [Rhizopus arrhizus]